MPEPPYKPARLVNDDKPLSTRWYILFYVWDATKEKLVKKRDYKINQYKTKTERLAFARKLIREIDKYLAQGYAFNPRKKQDEKIAIYTTVDRNFTIDEAFKFILPIVKSTKRAATYNSYNSVASLFLSFCEQAGWTYWKIRTITQVDVITWLDYLQGHENIGNSTRNKYLSYISAMFSMMKERNVLTANVCMGIKMLKVDVSSNTAYTEDEIIILKAAMLEEAPRLWLFVTFLLYGFIRPAEIGRIKVNMIDLNGGKIHLPGNITKNGHPRAVRISQYFKNYILELNLSAYRQDDFVFGKNLITGPVAIQKNFASTSHTAIARDKGFSSNYTLYSWKHTGVIKHYRAGVDIKTLQAQIGHRSLEETDTYLRSLHLYENTEIEDKSPAI